MIRPEELDKTYSVTYNRMVYTVTIADDPEQFGYYRMLGLDVFKEEPKKKSTKKKADLDDSSTESND